MRVSSAGKTLAVPKVKLRLALCCALALLTMLSLPIVARAHFDSSVWSYNTNQCSGGGIPIDPITLTEYGFTAYYALARSRLEAATGWTGNDDGAGQFASSHGTCSRMEGQSYTGLATCLNCYRYHIRYNQTYHKDAVGRFETVGTPHYEYWAGCGHVVTTFTGARDYVLNQMYAAGYDYSWQYWGATAPRGQCNGSSVGSDGYNGWVNLG